MVAGGRHSGGKPWATPGKGGGTGTPGLMAITGQQMLRTPEEQAMKSERARRFAAEQALGEYGSPCGPTLLAWPTHWFPFQINLTVCVLCTGVHTRRIVVPGLA